MPIPDEKNFVPFIQHASEILGETNKGLSGPEIVKAMAAYAVEYDIDITYDSYPFPAGTSNKRTALFEDLMAFKPKQQYRIIKELCEHRSFPLKPSEERKTLKIQLVRKYNQLYQNVPILKETSAELRNFRLILSLQVANRIKGAMQLLGIDVPDKM